MTEAWKGGRIHVGFGHPVVDPPKIQSVTLYDGEPKVMRMNSGSQSYTFRKSGKIAGEQVTTTVGCVKDGVTVHEYPEGDSPCEVCGHLWLSGDAETPPHSLGEG